MTHKILNRAVLCASSAPFALGLALAFTAPAYAQTTDAPAATTAATDATGGPNSVNDEVVVTGSRIRRPELQSVSPIAVIGSAAIQSQGITNIQDLAQKLPQLGIPGASRTNTNFSTTGNGVSILNLRNLGSNRTLVLVNGRRFVAGLAGTSTVDVNNIPTEMIDRVEVVTGGASAVYGSDAISGVVNFILKDHFDGITARAQYGISSKGDNANYTASITGGATFGPDKRGSIVGNFTYAVDKGLFSRDRAISAEDCLYICGPTAYSSYAAQGRFQLMNGAAASSNTGGFTQNLFTFNPDNSVVLGFPVGYGFNRNGVRRIAVPLKRYLGTVTGNYELSDHITAFIEGTYAKTKSSSQIEASPLDSATNLGTTGYPITNPFIPASIAAQIAARNSDGIASNNVTSISFRRRQNEVFTRSNTNDRDTYRIAGGFRGDITDKWSFDVSGVYGVLKDHTETQDIDITKYAFALDAIRDGSGNIVCRDATARAAGCVPINLFGYNTASPEASAYVQSDEPRTDDIKNTELVLNAAITGTLFALPYGDVKTSFGVEYRREKSVDNWDELTNQGLNSGNQTPDTIGKFNVKEAFGELDVPLLEDVTFAKSLSLNGKARYSDYSTIGNVFSWSAGAEWAPINDIRIRGNYSVANRAPNIGELFSAQSETFPSVQDPCNGVRATTSNDYSAACRAIPQVAAAIASTGSFTYSQADLQGINGFDGGNPNLQEEKAKTWTLGAVFQPSFFRGFSFTADYFNIKIDDAIGNISRTTSIQQCLLTGLSQFCNNVIRSPQTGFITTVNAQLVNIASYKTSGIDFDLRYGHALGLFGDDRFDTHVLWTRTLKYKTQSDPSAPIDNGLGNIEYGEVFKNKVYAEFTYTVGRFSINWNAQYLSKMINTPESEFDTPGTIDFLLSQGLTQEQADRAVSHNKIKSRIYHDVQLRAFVGENKQFEMFVGANNLFNRKPPILEDGLYYGSVTGTTTASDVYDPYGRRFYAGVQVHF
ncbi:TonB-dependent receptor domain-containing protein [Sphingomonas crusticola]|uniref:TonB-dependent receptor domain-containing protein n=1 Tax=Sphingomonas crusticola TaxID=1697973 RepID=UPI0013C2A66F|nr:TonB-dependent receptor [Sphingomonas crusticola]